MKSQRVNVRPGQRLEIVAHGYVTEAAQRLAAALGREIGAVVRVVGERRLEDPIDETKARIATELEHERAIREDNPETWPPRRVVIA